MENFLNRTKIRQVLYCILLILPLTVYSQKKKKGEEDDAKAMIEEADKLYKEGKKKQALEIYDKVEAIVDKEDLDFLWKIGNAYLESLVKYKAFTYLLEIERLNPNYHPDLKLKIGEAYESMYDYDNALKNFNEYKTIAKKGLKLDFVNKKIQEATWGKEMSAIDDGSIVVNVINEPVNSKFHDYGPKITPDGVQMIFTSRRFGSTGQKVSEDGNFFEDIFVTNKLSTGGWEFPTSISPIINTENHDAAVSISEDGRSILIYKGEENGSIFLSKKAEGQWSIPVSLGPTINTKSRESTATFAGNDQTIIFSSDRAGTKGKLDLWISSLGSDGKWSKAVNLGGVINTAEDEESPFMSGNTLYFSSSGHLGLGGYDVFKSNKNGDQWGTPINMASPINSPNNDLYFVITADQSRAYFSSARPEGVGGYDIFEIRFDGVKELSDTTPVYDEPVEAESDEEVLSKLTFTPLNSFAELLDVLNEGANSAEVKDALNIEEITTGVNKENQDDYKELAPTEEIIISNPTDNN